MYLSRLILNPRSHITRRDIADCQSMHRTLLGAFPLIPGGPAAAREHYGVLYRVETIRATGMSRLYVQSTARPDWSTLPDGYLAVLPDNPACKSVSDLYARLTEGTVLTFTLKASPTRTTGTSLKSERLAGLRRNGKRVFLGNERDQLDWLRRKGSHHGFALVELRTVDDLSDVQHSPAELIVGRRLPSGSERGSDVQRDTLCFRAITFTGRLRIDDIDRFRLALARGIGAGKAYGMGLLSVAPMR